MQDYLVIIQKLSILLKYTDIKSEEKVWGAIEYRKRFDIRFL